MSQKTILGVALAAFALLCLLCIRHTAPIIQQMQAGAAASGIPAAMISPALRAVMLNGKVTLGGTLPDESTKARVIARANELYGAGNYVDELKVDGRAANAGWLAAAPSLLPPLGREMKDGGVIVEGGTLTATGALASEESKARVLKDLTDAGGANLRVIDRLSVAGSGSPAAAQLQASLNQQLAGETIEFETNSDVITPAGRLILDQVVQQLNAAPDVPVEISGHTDSRGSAALNLDLSRRRAGAVRRYLTTKGVAGGRLTTGGYGDTQPVADNSTPQGQQKNRRTEFRVKQGNK